MIPPPHVTLPRSTVVAGCFVVLVTLSLVSSAATGAIRVWVVGSPYKGNVPEAPAALHLRQESNKLGYDVSVETFPARGFAATFADAVARNAAPDVLVFDNFGVMEGTTTVRGRFDGIGQAPTLRQQFIKVTGAFDELLGPERGWTYLFASSPNYNTAKALAMQAPDCPSGSVAATQQSEIGRIVLRVATAYLAGDAIGVQEYSDPDRLPAVRVSRETINVGGIRSCGVWGNDKLAIASVHAAYAADAALGHARVLLVLRKPASQWQLLVAARDPVSNDEFIKEVARLAELLAPEGQIRALPIPARLLSPTTGQFPQTRRGERFGSFRWESSPSEGVAAEVVEFAYEDDARLFFTQPPQPGARSEISAGRLWTTGRDWSWRVWTVSRSGDVVFSEWRMFIH